MMIISFAPNFFDRTANDLFIIKIFAKCYKKFIHLPIQMDGQKDDRPLYSESEYNTALFILFCKKINK